MSEAEQRDIRWGLTTYGGSRREQLRQARKLTLSARFARMREREGRSNPELPPAPD